MMANIWTHLRSWSVVKELFNFFSQLLQMEEQILLIWNEAKRILELLPKQPEQKTWNKSNKSDSRLG